MRGAIFDMDGLLLDSERVFQATWRELALEYGVTLDDSFTGEICGSSREKALEILRRRLPMADPAAVHDECIRRVEEKEARGVPLKKGVRTILEGLRSSGCRCAVASSSLPEMIRRNLALAGVDGFFDVFVSGHEVANGKPAPDVFLRAAELIGLPPAECYVFEDSLNGIRAGHAAGCRAVMIPDLIAPTEDIRPLCAAILPDLAAAWEEIRAGRL